MGAPPTIDVTPNARMASRLGLAHVHSDLELVSVLEKRLPLRAIQSLRRAGLRNDEVYALIVPRRTLAHRTANREPLSVQESERAMRVARITALAEQVFGVSDRAWSWMRETKQRFDGRTPLGLLATELGARLVEEALIQLDHGMFA